MAINQVTLSQTSYGQYSNDNGASRDASAKGANSVSESNEVNNTDTSSRSLPQITGKVIDFKNNRIILDTGEEQYADITLKEKVPDYIKKGDNIEIDSNEIASLKQIPRSFKNASSIDFNEMDMDKQILSNFQLPFESKHIDAISILKQNGMSITKESIVSLVNLQKKLEFVVDNASPAVIDNLTNIENADDHNIDFIFSEIKKAADSLPLDDNIKNLQDSDIDNICNNLKDTNIPSEKLSSIVKSLITNDLSPTRNNVSKVNKVSEDVLELQKLNGRTIGYVIKNNIQLTINNLLKAKMSFDGINNLNRQNYLSGISSNSQGISQYNTPATANTKNDIDNLTDDIVKVLKLENLPVTDENIAASKLLIENDIDVNQENVIKVTNIQSKIQSLSKTLDTDTISKLLKNNVNIGDTDVNKLVDAILKVKANPKTDIKELFNSLRSQSGTALLKSIKPSYEKSVELTNPNNIDFAEKNIIKVLKSTNYTQISFLDKNNIESSIKNLIYSKIILAAHEVKTQGAASEDLKNTIKSVTNLSDEATDRLINILKDPETLSSIQNSDTLQKVCEQALGIRPDKSTDFESKTLYFAQKLNTTADSVLINALKDNLNRHDIAVNDENISAAKALIESNLPLDSSQIDKIKNFTEFLQQSGDTPNNLLNKTVEMVASLKTLTSLNYDKISNAINLGADYFAQSKEEQTEIMKDLSDLDISSLNKTLTNNLNEFVNYYDNLNDSNAGNKKLNLDAKKIELNIKDILKSLSMTVDKDNLKAAKILISSQLEVTKDNMNSSLSLMQSVRNLSSIKQKDIPSLVTFLDSVIQNNKQDGNTNNLTKIASSNLTEAIDKLGLKDVKDIFDLPAKDLSKLLNTAFTDYKQNRREINNIIKHTINDSNNNSTNEVTEVLQKSLSGIKNINYKSLGFLIKNNIKPSIANISFSKSIFQGKKLADFSTLDANKNLFGNNKTPEMPKDLDPKVEAALDSRIKTVLGKMGLDDNEDNMEAAKALVQNTLPVGKDTLFTLKDIKNCLNYIYSNARFAESIPDNFSEIDVRNLSKMMEETITQNPEQNARRNKADIISGILDEFKNFDSAKLSFMIKNNIPFSLKNIYSVSKFTDNEFQLGKQIEVLKQAVNKSSNAILQMKVNNLMDSFLTKMTDISKLKDDYGKVFNDIKENVNDIASFVKDNSVANSSAITKTCYDISSNIQFQDKYNQSNTLLQVPLNLNNQLTNLQIYVMNDSNGGSKKQLNPENMNVYLHLNTENLGIIDTFLNFKSKNLSLRFGVDTEDAGSLISTDGEGLKDVLSNLGFNNVNITHFVRNEEINILNAKNTMNDIISKEIGAATDDSKAKSNGTSASDLLKFDLKA